MYSFRALLTDLAGNLTNGSTSTTTLTIDTVLPGAFQTGSVSISGGIVQAGYWNASNTGLTFSIPIADDATLTDGTVQIQGSINNGGYQNLGSAAPISTIDTTQTVSLLETDVDDYSSYANASSQGKLYRFQALITDKAGNQET